MELSDLTDFLSKCAAPAMNPVIKAYRTYRNNVIFNKDFVKTYDPSMPRLTDAQKEELDSYYGRYGFCMKPYYNYYRFLTAANGVFSPRFIFGSFFNKEILPSFNTPQMSPAWSDKCYLDKLLPGVLVPRTILRNINGYFFDESFKPVNESCAKKIIGDHADPFIVKKSIFSSGGKSIKLQENFSEGAEIFGGYKKNFVVQEVVRQHPLLSDMNASSLNTLRIISLNFKNKISILISALRVGAEGSCVDNISSGGVAFGVNDEGMLLPTAREYWGWPVPHPKSETVKKNKTMIPSFDKIIEVIKEQHPRFPHFGFIAWDFAVDNESRPVLVEINLGNFAVHPFQELAGRPFLGDITEEVLREAGSRNFI